MNGKQVKRKTFKNCVNHCSITMLSRFDLRFSYVSKRLLTSISSMFMPVTFLTRNFVTPLFYDLDVSLLHISKAF